MEENPNFNIEEDTLIYPRIESIFSDVNFKTEPIDIDEGGEHGYESIETAESSNDYYLPIPNKIILGSKPSRAREIYDTNARLESEPGPSTASDTWEDQDNFFECGHCNLLFPTQNELDCHKIASHSFLVARPSSKVIKIERETSVPLTRCQSLQDNSNSQIEGIRRQKAVKSTAKSALNKTFPILLHNALKNSINNNPHGNTSLVCQTKESTEPSDRLLCKHCDVRFPNEIALIKHTYELLPENKFRCDICQTQFNSKPEFEGHRITHFRKKGSCDPAVYHQMFLQCVYCSCFLLYPTHMRKHLLSNHKITEFVTKYAKFTGQCAICSITVDSYRKYNNHVMKCHRKEFFSKTFIRFDHTPVKMKCMLCSEVFTSRYSAYKHKAEKHSEFSQKQTFVTVYDKPIKPIPPNPPPPVKVKHQTVKKILLTNNFIPKQTLFKCNKCQIHFVSCSTAFAHSKRCSLAKGDWKCDKCRRTFTKVEKSIHTQQHQFSEKFKVHIVSDKILSKILCQCPKCEIHFDETVFANHVPSQCTTDNGVECKTCNLKIHPDSIANHKRHHIKNNFSNSDFIVIAFIDPSFQNTLHKENNMPHIEYKKMPKEMLTEDYKQILLYCANCKCHSYSMKSTLSYHLEGKCKLLNKQCCKICGLGFSFKPFRTHITYDHNINNLKLDDFKIRRIQDSEVINPVMPDFFRCNNCEVFFISSLKHKNHVCSKQVFIKCSICFQKYDSDTYDLHLAYHNYRRSKTESSLVPLKIYSCVACNYAFQSYDGVVDHCQKHYINSEMLDTQNCKICNLKYADDNKHLHKRRVSYELYKFDYEKLMTDNWLDGFNPLPKDAVDNILSRSVYGAFRNIRLELLVEGPVERTIYRCVQCELNFNEQDVLEHTMKSCFEGPHFKCGSCSAAFISRDAKKKHVNIHVVYGDDITFREIIFNHKDDKELNEALKAGKQKESLKFRKCPQCELLIKKSDYQAHITAHNKDDFKQFTFSRKNEVLSYKLFRPATAARKLYTVYKCKTCNACIMQKINVARHKCASPKSYKRCAKCYLYFLPWMYARHVKQHKTSPKFNSKNISVVEFELQNIVKKRRRYSSDDDVSPGSCLPIIVSKKYDTRKIMGKPYTDNLSEESQDYENDASTDNSSPSNAYAKKYIKKTCIEKSNPDNEYVDSQEKSLQDSPPKKEEFVKKFDIEKWRIDMRNKLYQCHKCYLCFVQRKLLINHLLECDDNSFSETPLVCDRCDMVFQPSLISFHEKLHEIVNRSPKENYFYLINVSTNGINTRNKDRWIYKCKLCDFHYINTKSLETHFINNHTLQNYLDCEVCGMRFPPISCKRHVRKQHYEGKWSKDDLHVEIAQKKIVNSGEIHLTAFVRPHLQDNNKSVEICESIEDSQSTDVAMKTDDLTLNRTIDIDTENSDTAQSATLPLDQNITNCTDGVVGRNLYKCAICCKYYLTKSTIVRHISTGRHSAIGIRCDICGLLFSKRTLDFHIKTQHKKLKLSCEDFIVITLNENQISADNMKRDENVSGVFNASDNPEEVSDSVHVANQSQIEVHNNRRSESYKNISKEVKSDIYSSAIDNHVYKCVECSVYYTNRSTLLMHIVVKKHKSYEFLKCDLCGLMFGSGSLKKHKIVQHEKLNLTLNDFIITDVFGSKIVDDEQDSVKNTMSIDTDDRPLIKYEDKKKRDTDKNGIKCLKLFQCIHCRVCVNKSQRYLHVCCSDIQKKQCIYCCLTFRNTDVFEHRRLHQRIHKLSRKNFILIPFGHRSSKVCRIYKCDTCSTHFLNLNTLEWHMDTWNHQTKRAYCEKCGLFFGKNSLSRHVYIHHTKLNFNVQQFNITCVSDMNSKPSNSQGTIMDANNLPNNVNTAVVEQDDTSNVKTINKLFKCVECDVYFLTRSSYYHHIYKHKKLDATQYIDCNICDLQFLNEALGVHMKSHKDKSFCLDKLLIEEYQPNTTDLFGIKTYFAKDILNSKLVSTTTPFDNDDDSVARHTDEQLSIIDSTSDEVPKVAPGVTVEAVNNIYPPNSINNNEESLNESVELPNLDVSVKLND